MKHINTILLKFVYCLFQIQDEDPVLSYDPLPPLDSINIYKKPTANSRPDSSNIFSLFFSSLFRNINGAAAALNDLNLL